MKEIDLQKDIKMSFEHETLDIDEIIILSYDLKDKSLESEIEKFEKLDGKLIKITGREGFYRVRTYTPMKSIDDCRPSKGYFEDDTHMEIIIRKEEWLKFNYWRDEEG